MNSVKKALIIDDEEKARLYLASIISELYPQLEIQLASTPAEALFILKKQQFNVILMDVEMPGMTGLELLEQLRVEKSKTPVIYVSAYKRAEFIQKALRLDAIDYIDKPVNPTELDNALMKAFELKPNADESINDWNRHRFCLLTDSGEMFIEPNEIIYFEALNRYSTAFFSDGKQKVVRDNLEGLSKKLPENTFLRVSRQYIVNLDSIKYISKGNKTIVLQWGLNQIQLSKIYPAVISDLIDKYSI